MMTSSGICFELISSTLVSDLYGLTLHILYLTFIAPYCYVTAALVNTLRHYK